MTASGWQGEHEQEGRSCSCWGRSRPSGPGLREVGSTFAPVVKAWRATAADYSDNELRLLLEFQGKLEEIMRSQLARLRGDGEAPPKPA